MHHARPAWAAEMKIASALFSQPAKAAPVAPASKMAASAILPLFHKSAFGFGPITKI